MRKVSRSMLATIAALQSGVHSRRKIKYVREKALVSHLYPIHTVHSIKASHAVVVGGLFLGRVKAGEFNHASGGVYIEASKRRVLYDIKADLDSATYMPSALISLAHKGAVEHAINSIDITSYQPSATLTLNCYEVNFISLEENKIADYRVSASLIIRVKQ
ncbi:hypothetical protein [Pseudoalteromonas phage vB_Pun_Y3]